MVAISFITGRRIFNLLSTRKHLTAQHLRPAVSKSVCVCVRVRICICVSTPPPPALPKKSKSSQSCSGCNASGQAITTGGGAMIYCTKHTRRDVRAPRIWTPPSPSSPVPTASHLPSGRSDENTARQPPPSTSKNELCPLDIDWERNSRCDKSGYI